MEADTRTDIEARTDLRAQSRMRSRARARDPLGNARLTAVTAVSLLVLLAVEGATLLSLQTFISWHIFVGMLLVPVVGLKLISTGHRFLSYYRGTPAYVEAGPPVLLLRLLGPIVVLSTLGLFATGVALAALGPGTRGLLLLHKASFVVWVGAMSLHVLGHLLRLPALAGPDLRVEEGGRSGARLFAVAFAIVLGTMLALATLPTIPAWEHLIQRGG